MHEFIQRTGRALLGRVLNHNPAASVSLFALDRWQGADHVEPHERCIIGFLDVRPEGVVGSAELLFILRAELAPIRSSRQVLYAAYVRKADDLIAGSLRGRRLPALPDRREGSRSLRTAIRPFSSRPSRRSERFGEDGEVE